MKTLLASILAAIALAAAPPAHTQPPPPPDCTWLTGTPPPPQHLCPVLQVPGFPMPVFNFGFFPTPPLQPTP